jgi:predicted nucleic acid-binding protein
VFGTALHGLRDEIKPPLEVMLARPRLQKYVSADEAPRFVADLAVQRILRVDPPGPHRAVCRDPRDDYLVALAEASGAWPSGQVSLFERWLEQGAAK